MKNKSHIVNLNRNNISLNYLSNSGKYEIFNNDLYNEKNGNFQQYEANEIKENSFLINNKTNIKNLSVDKYNQVANAKKCVRNNSTEYNNKNLNETKTKLNLNLNLNLNVNGMKNEKKVEEFLNSNFSKLDNSKLTKIITRSPLHNNISLLCENKISKFKNLKKIYPKNLNLILNNNSKKSKIIINLAKIDYEKYFTSPLSISGLNNSVNLKLQSFLEEDDENVKDVRSLNELKDLDPMKYHKLQENMQDLKCLKILIDKLRKTNNKDILIELDNIIKDYNGEGNNLQLEKENRLLKNRIEEIDKKFEILIKENKELKRLIKTKTVVIDRLNLEMLSFKKELNSIKSRKNIRNTNTTFNKPDHFSKDSRPLNLNETFNNREIKPYKYRNYNKNRSTSNIKHNQSNPNISLQTNSISKTPIKNKGKPVLKDLCKLDTIELLKRAQLDDPKKVLYLPAKVNTSLGTDQIKVPKLDIVIIYNFS